MEEARSGCSISASPNSSKRRTSRPMGWADLDGLCLPALQKEPARRYRSVEALIRDVDHYVKNEPLEARPDTVGYRVGKFVKRHRGAVSSTALAVAVLVTLVVFF